MIRGTNITKSFGKLQVLKGLDVHIPENQIVSIVGASGAGKTTLLQILGTLEKADTGQIIVDNIDISNLKGNDLANFRNQHIAFIFQFYYLLPEFTALENVCIPAYVNGVSKASAEKRAKELLDYLNISDRATHKPSELSGGEQQRVAIARALINDPKVIFADEPSGNLDTDNKQELHNLFIDLKKEFNKTFVIVTHDNDMAEISDAVLTMKDGVFV
jgi:lipoprotein-releasing system ATP-binding protein